ncbi:S1C family serine protease [Deinococcus navajonensis]|uniref:S1C family serine protease n=1 Tax=Deinococcus navajonensis TaxID=309884 RepID=A0ABV8XNC3_9DEIO
MRASPWLPVLLILALGAYLLPETRGAQDAATPPAADAAEPARPGVPTGRGLPGSLPEASRAVFRQARPATVRIESLDLMTQEGGIGTGFFITPDGQLLTAYHVVSTGSLFQVTTLSGQSYRAQVVGFDEQADVALLKVQGRGPFPVLNLVTRAPRVGEMVLGIGNSGGDFLQPRRGQLLNLNVEAGRADFPQGTLEMNAPLAPGDSGGPVVDGNGQAIGVISYIRVDDSGLTRRSYAVPVVEGNQLITALRAGEKRDVGVAGLIFDLIHSGRTDPPGAVVTRVARDSPAARAGLRGSELDENGNLTRLGDIIVSVNGQSTPDADAVIRALRGAGVGAAVTLGYVRNGQPAQVKVTLVARASVPDLRE